MTEQYDASSENDGREKDPPVVPVSPATALATAPRPPVKAWRWWIHLFLIAAYPLLIGILGLGGEADGPALQSDARGLLLVCAEQMLVFGVIFGVAWVASRASKEELLWKWRGGLLPIPLGIGYSVALRLAVGLFAAFVVVILLLTRVFTLPQLQEFVMANRPDIESVVDIPAMRQNPVYYWLTLTVVSFVVAGFREELWRVAFIAGMKGIAPRVFSSKRGQFGAVAIAAVIFGFGHLGQGPLAVVLTGILGFGLGAIMVFHRSIWPAVIAHGMFDATSLALIPWLMEIIQDAPPTAG